MAIIGGLIAGKYEILKMIGRGGMSEVYLAMDKNLNKQWAVKEIKKNVRDRNNTIIVQSAIAEANMMKKLDHPCLPRIVDIIDREDVIYVVMDYIEGEPLSKVLEKGGAQPQETVIGWAEELCGVLDYLHTQEPPIIYRDMKPANIMLQPNGNIKLIDFGIAREYKSQNLEDTVSLGTKGYAAPEQFGGKGQTDCRTDIYCFGVTLYHLLTGKNPCEPPYELYPIRYWNSDLSAGLESIIVKCTQLNPQDRYQSCIDLMYDINNYEKVDGSYRNRQKRKIIIVAALTLLSIIFLAVGVIGQVEKNKATDVSYQSCILSAEKESDTDEKMNLYAEAILIKGNELDAYLGLVNTMKEDATFSVDEETILIQAINPNLLTLREQADYSDLAFEIGKLYWFYYDYGKENGADDNHITRMKSAIQWFKDAHDYGSVDKEYHEIADVYSDIGTFNKDITLNVEEASDKGLYAPYFSNLLQLLDTVSREENEIVNLEVYSLCIHSVEMYARKFKNDGISEQQLRDFLSLVLTSTDELVVSTDKTQLLKKSVLARKKEAETAVNNAYAE